MGIKSPESYCQPPLQHSAYNFPSHDQPIEEKSEVMKSIKTMIESQEQKLKNDGLTISIIISNPRSLLHVPNPTTRRTYGLR